MMQKRCSMLLLLLVSSLLMVCISTTSAFVPCPTKMSFLDNTRTRNRRIVRNVAQEVTNNNDNNCSDDDDDDEQQQQLLQALGWQPHFADQLLIPVNNEDSNLTPVRITEVRGSGLHVVGAGIDEIIRPRRNVTVVVGDWVLLSPTVKRPKKLLERKSLIKRRAPGPSRKIQLIAANLDTVFVVSSCNQDFNVARMERYVAMALEANVAPVIVLTKRDLYDDLDDEEAPAMLDSYLQEAKGIAGSTIPVVFLDARGEEPTHKLAEWIRPGQTVAFLGSSGVGKSTIVNSLCGFQVAPTGPIHEDSGQGRHTTTRRQLFFLPNGCAILDTPGLRELQLIDAANGLAEVFSDFVELSRQCRFNDCKHVGEPGCAIEAALKNDEIDGERLARWEKLVEEDLINTQSLAEAEAQALQKEIRKNQQKKNKKFIIE